MTHEKHSHETTTQALVWIDHREARIVHAHADPKTTFDVVEVAGDDGQTHERKHDGGHRHTISAPFADRVAGAVRGYGVLVVTGPSTAKDELMAHLRERHHEIAARVALLETLDRATDPQLAAKARSVFMHLDPKRKTDVPPPA